MEHEVDADPERRLFALSDLLTPWAIRAAAELGLADALAGGPSQHWLNGARMGFDGKVVVGSELLEIGL